MQLWCCDYVQLCMQCVVTDLEREKITVATINLESFGVIPCYVNHKHLQKETGRLILMVD